jgi:phage gpG-like protein
LKLIFDQLKMFSIPNPLSGESYTLLKNDLKAAMLRQKDLLFGSGNDPGGSPWKPLSALRTAQKLAKNTMSKARIKKLGKAYTPHKILNDTGTLMKAVSLDGDSHSVQSTSGDEVTIGTNLPYAAIQNFGGTIVPKNGKLLAFPGLGGATIFAKKVVIPARPFIGFAQKDNDDLSDVTANHLRKVMNGE